MVSPTCPCRQPLPGRFQIRSSTDLTGTVVSANKPVAVFSGSEWTSVGADKMGDHLVEQMPPTPTWGWDFITVPIATRRAGDIFRVLGRSTSSSMLTFGHRQQSDTISSLEPNVRWLLWTSATWSQVIDV